MEIQSVEIPKKKVEIFRAMQPGESIQVEESKRQSNYHQAQKAVPTATWRTVKINGKVYLNRVS